MHNNFEEQSAEQAPLLASAADSSEPVATRPPDPVSDEDMTEVDPGLSSEAAAVPVAEEPAVLESNDPPPSETVSRGKRFRDRLAAGIKVVKDLEIGPEDILALKKFGLLTEDESSNADLTKALSALLTEAKERVAASEEAERIEALKNRKPDPIAPQIVLNPFKKSANSSLISFETGQVVTDQLILRALFSGGCGPFLAPLEAAGRLQLCERFNQLYFIPEPLPSGGETELWQSDGVFQATIRGASMDYVDRQIIHDPDDVRLLLAGRFPLKRLTETGRARHFCPFCGIMEFERPWDRFAPLTTASADQDEVVDDGSYIVLEPFQLSLRSATRFFKVGDRLGPEEQEWLDHCLANKVPLAPSSSRLAMCPNTKEKVLYELPDRSEPATCCYRILNGFTLKINDSPLDFTAGDFILDSDIVRRIRAKNCEKELELVENARIHRCPRCTQMHITRVWNGSRQKGKEVVHVHPSMAARAVERPEMSKHSLTPENWLARHNERYGTNY